MTKKVLAAIAEVLPDNGHHHISRLDVRRGWGDILNIRLHATTADGEGLEARLREAIEKAVGDQRHSIEIVWSPPGRLGLESRERCSEDLRPVHEHNYPSDLERDVATDASTHYRLRPIRPDDAPKLVAFHNGLADRSVYLRFFSFHRELSAKEVENFTCVDYVNRLALVAEVDDRLIAVGRFERTPGATEAEVAFVVSDEYQHHGIGSELLDDLSHAARQRGILAFRAETLVENRAMLDVFRHAGFPITSSVDYGTVTLRFPIALTDSYRTALARREAERCERGAMSDLQVERHLPGQ